MVFNLVEVGWTLTKLPQGRTMRDNQRGFMRLPLTLGSGADRVELHFAAHSFAGSATICIV